MRERDFDMNMNLNAVNRQPTFQLQNGQLDVQAKQFIKQFDTDLDGSLSQEEVGKSSGLMGAVQTKVTNAQLAQALWASIAGPTNTINAKEYAAFLLTVDGDQNGMITQAEADAYVANGSQAFKNLGLTEGVKGMYQTIISNGNQVGLDKAFGTTQEEQFALGETTEKPPVDEGALLNAEPLSKEELLAFSTAQVVENPEINMILIKQAMLQVGSSVASIFGTDEAATPGTVQNQVAMKRMEKMRDAELRMQQNQNVLQQFLEQIQDEVKKQGVGDKISPELEAFRTKQQPVLDKLLVDWAKEETDSPKAQTLFKQILDIDKADYNLYLKANPEVSKIIQDLSRKNALAIQNGTFQVKEVSLDDYEPMAWSQKDNKMAITKAKALKSQLSTVQAGIKKQNEDLDYIKNNPTQNSASRAATVKAMLKSLTIQEGRIKNDLVTVGYPIEKVDTIDSETIDTIDTIEDTTTDTLPTVDGILTIPTTSTTTPANDDIGLPLV